MGNLNNKKFIKIYGVTLPRFEARAEAYSCGEIKVNGELVAYVDYFIDHLITCIKEEGLEKEIIKKLI